MLLHIIVCFLNGWPQTKCRVTFDTCFWHIFYALSHGTLGFALHGSYLNHFLIGGNSSTANQIRWNKWLLKLPWKAELRVPCERASKTVLETGVKSDPAFCLGSSIKKTNSVLQYLSWKVQQNATNNLTSVFNSVINTLSDDVLQFAFCVVNKNPLFVGFWLAVEISQPTNQQQGLRVQHNEQNRAHHLKEH